ncbi:MAG: hypothetical protein AUK55_02725 [Syntrophobacteraceae bacterium CG2_30_61_12]|nr:MAG: hypothetical protein AUK55_02725 [Syntrophobacteraceae bacterium CG2_30_61_12]
MDWWSAVMLGLLQGITEFLPVSSSGHLVIAQQLLGWSEPNLFFDVSLHVGTLAAVLLVFRSDVADLIRGGLLILGRILSRSREPLRHPERLFLLVVAASIPTALLGFFARHALERLFASVAAVGVNLIITGSLLWLTRNTGPRPGLNPARTGLGRALGIGLAQGLALAPGISRSGSTIAVGLLLGLERDWAGRFSFLLFVPAVIGAVLLEALDLKYDPAIISSAFAGAAVAAVSGYVALRLLLRVVHRGAFYRFAPYCWLVGALSLVYSLF